ncbi:MAG: hypothetical protein DRJ97_04095 [Thermoprotei archaeon]|nr:MAG: hypothetical protein DRJ97_04095 [Thermoprotei archaeon]
MFQEARGELLAKSLLTDVVKALSLMVAYNKTTIDKLGLVAERAKNPVVKAYASYALHEVAKISKLLELAVGRLDVEGLKVSDAEEERLIGGQALSLIHELHEILDKLRLRVTKARLTRFATIGRELAKLLAVQGMAYAKVVEDAGRDPWAAKAIRRASKELLSMSSKLKLMKRALALFSLLAS